MQPFRMLVTVGRMEWVQLRRDGRFWLATSLYVAMILFAAAFAWTHHHQVESERIAAQTSERERWVHQGEKHPHAAAHYGIYLFRPVHPLGWVESGTTPYVGTALFLEAHRKNELVFRPVDDGTGMERFGVFNLATVLAVFVPLLIILVFHDRLSAESEQQTLPLLICQGLSPWQLFFGKLGAGLWVLSLWLGLAAALTAFLVSWARVPLFAGDTLGRIILLYSAYGALAVLFLSATLTASAWTRSSFNTVAVMLGFWMIGFLVAPRVLNDHAARVFPLPTRFAFEVALQEDLNERDALRERIAAATDRLLAEHGVADLAELPVNFRAVNLQLGEDHGNAVFDRHYGALFDRLEEQNRWVAGHAVWVPVLAARAVGMAVAGTDFAHHRDFIESAELYRREMQRRLNEDLFNHPESPDSPYLADRRLWESIPPWEYASPRLREVDGLPWAALGGLLAWNLILPLFGWRGVSRLFARP